MSGFNFALEALNLREEANRVFLNQYQDDPAFLYQDDSKEIEASTILKTDKTNQKRSHSYSCKDCDYRSFSSKEFLYHRRNEHQDVHAIHECKLCSYAARHLNKVERHCQAVHKIEIPDSNLIRRKKKSKPKKIDELSTDEGNDVFVVSDYEPEDFINTPEETRLRQVNDNEYLPGTSLLKIVNTASLCDDGQEVTKQTPRIVFKCTKCDYQSLSRFILNQHDKSVHMMKKLFRCLKCAFVTNNRLRYLKHIKEHCLPKPNYPHVNNVGLIANGYEDHAVDHFILDEPLPVKQEYTPTGLVENHLNYMSNSILNGNGYVGMPVVDKGTSGADSSDTVYLTKKKNTESQITAGTPPDPSKPSEYPCPLCGAGFENLPWLARHLNQKHTQSQGVKLLVQAVQEIDVKQKWEESSKQETKKNVSNKYLAELPAMSANPAESNYFQSINVKEVARSPRGQLLMLDSEIDVPFNTSSTNVLSVSSGILVKEAATSSRRRYFTPNVTSTPSSSEANCRPLAMNIKENYLAKVTLHAERKNATGVLQLEDTPIPETNRETKKNKQQFFCRVCDHREHLLSKIEKHVMTHRKGKIYPCPACKHRCRWKNDMKKHITNMHDNEDLEIFNDSPNPLSKDIGICEFAEEMQVVEDLDRTLEAPVSEPKPFKKPKTKAELMAMLEAEEKTVSKITLATGPSSPVKSKNKDSKTKHPQVAKKSCPTRNSTDSPLKIQHNNMKQKRTLADFWTTDSLKPCHDDGTPINFSFEQPEKCVQQNFYSNPYTKNNVNKRPFDVIEDLGDIPQNKKQKKMVSSPKPTGNSVPDKKYKCIYCPFSSVKASRFHVHIVQHLNTKPYMCSICLLRSNWEWDIGKHIKAKKPRHAAHRGAEILIADETGLKNYEKYNMYLVDVESKDSEPDESAPLEICSFQEMSSSTAEQENIPIDDGSCEPVSDRIYSCGHCLFQHRKMTSVILHLGLHSVSKPYKCRICGHASYWKHVISRHINSAHTGNSKDLLGKVKYKLKGDRLFLVGATQDVKESAPSNDHQSAPSMSCTLCPYTTGFKHHLQMHLARHIEPETVSVKCPHCPFWVKYKKSLFKHLKLHKSTEPVLSEPQPSPEPTVKDEQEFVDDSQKDDNNSNGNMCKYLCEYCPFSTTSKERLLSHKQFHRPNQNAPFSCSSCCYWSESERALNEHLKIHMETEEDKPKLSLAHFKGENKGSLSPIKMKKSKARQKVGKSTCKSVFPKNVSDLKISSCNSKSPKIELTTRKSNSRKELTCESCPFIATSKLKLLNHKQYHRPNHKAKYKCPHCSYWCELINIFKLHMKMHTQVSNEFVSATDEVPSIEDPIVMVKDKMKRFKCRFCPKVCSRLSDKIKHEARHYQAGAKKSIYSCNICGFQCITKVSHQVHNQLHKGHNKTDLGTEVIQRNSSSKKIELTPEVQLQVPITAVTNTNPSNPIKCRLCPVTCKKLSNMEKHLARHYQISGVKRRYSCEECGYQCDSKSWFSLHNKLHKTETEERETSWVSDSDLAESTSSEHLETEGSFDGPLDSPIIIESTLDNKQIKYFKCHFCPMKSQRNHNVKKHESQHYQVSFKKLEHSCEVCGYQTIARGPLLMHKRLHETESFLKKYPISTNSIESLETSSDLETHKQYKCHLCPMTYSMSNNLENHFAKHHRVNSKKGLKYSCQICGYQSISKSKILTHKKLHKGGKTRLKACLKMDQATVAVEDIKIQPDSRLPKSSKRSMKKKAIGRLSSVQLQRGLCERCPAIFVNNKKGFKVHTRLHGSRYPNACTLCDYRNRNKKQIEQHMIVHSPGYREKQLSMYYFNKNCSKIPLSKYSKKLNLDGNATLSKANIEKCCTDSSSATKSAKQKLDDNATSLKKQKLVPPSNYYNFSCNRCPSVFMTQEDYSRHEPHHGSSFPIACSYCDFRTDTQFKLNAHERVHAKGYREFKTASNISKLSPNPNSSTAKSLPVSNSNYPRITVVEASKVATTDILITEKKQTTLYCKNQGKGVNHKRTHSCKKCPMAYFNENDLLFHKSLHQSNSCHKCHKCTYAVDDLDLLNRHKMVHKKSSISVNSTPTSANSTLTEEIPLSIANSPQHMEDEHEKKLEDSTNVSPQALNNGSINKPYKCPECPATFNKVFRLEKHSVHHGATRRLVCKTCNYSVDSASLLSKHTKVHNSSNSEQQVQRQTEPVIRIKIFRCSKCPGIFYKNEKLSKHFQNHGAKRQYKCENCDYSVDSVYSFNSHKKVHKTDYKGLPKVMKPLPNKQRLEENLPTKNSEKLEPDTTECFKVTKKALKKVKVKQRYCCSRCPYASFRKENAISHLERHRNIKNVQNSESCPHCDYSTVTGATQKDHIRKHFQRRKNLKPCGYMNVENLEIWSQNDTPTLIFKDNGVNSKNRFFPVLKLDVAEVTGQTVDATDETEQGIEGCVESATVAEATGNMLEETCGESVTSGDPGLENTVNESAIIDDGMVGNTVRQLVTVAGVSGHTLENVCCDPVTVDEETVKTVNSKDTLSTELIKCVSDATAHTFEGTQSESVNVGKQCVQDKLILVEQSNSQTISTLEKIITVLSLTMDNVSVSEHATEIKRQELSMVPSENSSREVKEDNYKICASFSESISKPLDGCS